MSLELQISATFTAEPLRQPLEFWLRQLGLEMEVGFAGYQQVLQEALDPVSRSGRNAGGFNLFLIRLEDLAGDAVLPTVAEELGDAIAALAARSSATQLVVFCPDRQRNPEVEGLERLLADRWKPLGNVEAVLSNAWTSLYPVPEPYDPEMERVGRIPYAVEMFAALATMAVRRMS
ncbi:MAG: hypothetical protein KDL87_13105, partial [Verrucomicrobiae bacterium]|nr:hypothetical protein [Verrucomicrobiae bacterium]